mmetsp:Transcript_3371/g.11691  ORF Transcript_3371/g.11691 Transcript_3371/m.11691 type:complete len:209 (-) Transcript_3371:1144-1770(-)
MRRSKRRLTAWSSWYGVLVAARTSTFPFPPPLFTPCICTRISVLMRLAASLSPCPPRAPHRESISSMKMMAGSTLRARLKRSFMRVAAMPSNISTNSEPLVLKKGSPHSVATALASSVLPTPGGPSSRKPLGYLAPYLANSSALSSIWTASWISSRAKSMPATSLYRTPVVLRLPGPNTRALDWPKAFSAFSAALALGVRLTPNFSIT